MGKKITSTKPMHRLCTQSGAQRWLEKLELTLSIQKSAVIREMITKYGGSIW